MKLEQVLDRLNSLEKNAFLKIIDNIITEKPANQKAIESILSEKEKGLKNADNVNISGIFSLIEDEFIDHIRDEFVNLTTQLDIFVDIIIKDGHSILSMDWFNKLYDRENKSIKARLREFNEILDEKKEIDKCRLRDFKIYTSCLRTAYINDRENNQENKITRDEQTILFTLSKELELSQEEIKLIKYSILPLEKSNIEEVINYLRNIGILFYSKKNHKIYIPDEVVFILRKLRGKEVADKFLRRILNLLKDPQINNVCRKHDIDIKLTKEEKIKRIINEGISLTNLLSYAIFRDNVTLTERKNFINDLVNKGLNITPYLKGVTIEEKINNLIAYFISLEREDKIGITIDGYNNLLRDLFEYLPNLRSYVKEVFELEEDYVLTGECLLELGIKPNGILDLLTEIEMQGFCQIRNIKSRGNQLHNILESYKDTENIMLENYVNIGFRDFNALKENGITIKESELGIKFEQLTKTIFSKLGFNVDEQLRKKLNTNKDQVDIILNLGNNDIIIVECKTKKESGYNKFSSVSRQIKSYFNLANSNGLKVVKSLLIAPEFSDEFISDCEIEYELNLSLITAGSFISILKGLQKSKHDILPYNLLMRDVLIKEERILKAIEK